MCRIRLRCRAWSRVPICSRSPKRRRISTVSFVGVIEVGLFVGAWPRLELDQDHP